MRFFKPWTWFDSPERQLKLKELMVRLKAAELELKAAEVKLEKESSKEEDEEPEEETKRLFMSLRIVDGTAIVVLNDGTILTKNDVDEYFYDEVHAAETEDDLIDLFESDIRYDEDGQGQGEKAPVETPEEREKVWQNLDILRNNDQFVLKNNDVYLKDVPLPMPATVVGTFIEILERIEFAIDKQTIDELFERFEALKMFWMWTALNPIESSRRDLLHFVRKNDIKITKNGLLEMYRRVVSKGEKDKDYVNFISNNHYKVKKWGKDPAAYWVYQTEGGGHVISPEELLGDETLLGSLDELYNTLPQLEENVFTDAHTRSKTIRVGSVYQEDEDKIDLNNLEACSAGLHVGSREFMFGGFGDVGVVALVNPSKVRSVPVYDYHKMRVSEMFIAAIVDLDEYKNSVDDTNISDYSNEYFNQGVAELMTAVQSRNFDTLACQDRLTGMTSTSIEKICEMLANKVSEIA